MDFSAWNFASYHEQTSITFSVHHELYDAPKVEHSFTVTEVDCIKLPITVTPLSNITHRDYRLGSATDFPGELEFDAN